MKKYFLFIVFLIAGISATYATHNRAGEITYRYIGTVDLPYRYEITVTTYTKWVGTGGTDKCELTVLFGDGDSAVAPRVNGISVNCSAPLKDGELITPDTRKNIYITTHNYKGPGNYLITMEDPNRNKDICNIPDSENASFFLRSEIVISPFFGQNSSPILLNPPIDDACVGVCFEHNPGAYDADGDSLSYSLTTCYAEGVPISGWLLPPAMNYSSIDALRGDLIWCSPPTICQYNIAILIKEYRLITGTNIRYYIGSVLRDMQITVGSCSNTPPQISEERDTCVIAGTNLNFNVTASDVEFNLVTLTATGGPFLESPAATFSASSGISTASGTFNWTPNCSQVQLLPYLVTFKASDSDPTTPLVNYESIFIRVIAPAPTGLTAVPSGASMFLNWNVPFCGPTGSNPLIKYYIYRKEVCDPWTPSICETGVPAYTGYTLIGTTLASVLTFIDNNGGSGLINGIDYSYIVVAAYVDGSQSIASQHVCAKLVRDVPIITNVSVLSTGINDSIWTRWIKPIGSSTNLDTIINPPPYQYQLMRAVGFNPPASAYASFASYNYTAYWQLTDTSYVSNALNTQANPYTYRVDFYSNGVLKGSTNTASSIYLTTVPGDKKVTLSWKEFVPWVNYKYDIYRETATPGVFAWIDSTTTTSYIDSGLVNEVQYCYKIRSRGQYSDTTLPAPLYNFSQVKCETPVDLIPPCQPNFDVVTDCDVLQNVINWVNPNTYCSSDAVMYTIYFAPTVNDPLQIIYTSTDMNLTTYTLPIYYYENVASIAGCYAVTATDSALTPNESPIVNKICIDNCPTYELPNVFTPNNDGHNDLFTPLPNYRFVKDVEIKIYDRWGLLMFETTNPDVKWNGTSKDSKKPCADGTYFYTCVVNEIRVDGIKPRILKGFVQLIQTKTEPKY
jgi:gliding motility-associated-like protein